MPDFNRRQRSAPCTTCKGELRFYPKPLADDAAMVAETDTEGDWTHLNATDWIAHPHRPDPREDAAIQDAFLVDGVEDRQFADADAEGHR